MSMSVHVIVYIVKFIVETATIIRDFTFLDIILFHLTVDMLKCG